MIVVIIAGGSGSRLWPLSTPQYPKHLLSLTNDKSLLQNTYTRAALLASDIYIVTEKSHAHHIAQQLPDMPEGNIIAEPGRRGTAGCMLVALALIKRQHGADEPIVFMHADHHIRDVEAFTEAVKRAAEYAGAKNRLVLLGVEPTYPAISYGYIHKGENANGSNPIYNVKNFKEKPDYETAEEYVASGHYLWNMGFFVAPLAVFENSIQTYAPELWQNYQKLLAATSAEETDEIYMKFENYPIEIALTEKVPNLLVMPGTFDWMDVGSYPEVHQVNHQDDAGNTLQGKIATEDVTSSFVRNDTDIPLAVIGLDNVVVVSTPEGILVTSKTHAQRVGDVSKRFG